MRLLILSAGLLFSSAFHAAGQVNISHEKQQAAKYSQHHVKVVKSYRHKSSHGKGKISSVVVLDTLGREIESWSYLKIYKLHRSEYHTQSRYNVHGDLVEKKSSMKGDSPFVTTFSYAYNEQGNVTEKKTDRQFSDKWLYSYDASGKLICTQWYPTGDEHGAFFFVDSFYYENNTLVKYKRFNKGESLYFYFDYLYDAQGNLTQEMRFEKGDTTDIWIKKYDEHANAIETTHIDKLLNTEHSSGSVYNEQGLFTAAFGPGRKKRFYSRTVYEYN